MDTTRLSLNGGPGRPYGEGDNIFDPKDENPNPEPEPEPEAEGGKAGPRRKTGIGR